MSESATAIQSKAGIKILLAMSLPCDQGCILARSKSVWWRMNGWYKIIAPSSDNVSLWFLPGDNPDRIAQGLGSHRDVEDCSCRHRWDRYCGWDWYFYVQLQSQLSGSPVLSCSQSECLQAQTIHQEGRSGHCSSSISSFGTMLTLDCGRWMNRWRFVGFEKVKRCLFDSSVLITSFTTHVTDTSCPAHVSMTQ